eukprot:4177330-Amphidinium_carterae.2
MCEDLALFGLSVANFNRLPWGGVPTPWRTSSLRRARTGVPACGRNGQKPAGWSHVTNEDNIFNIVEMWPGDATSREHRLPRPSGERLAGLAWPHPSLQALLQGAAGGAVRGLAGGTLEETLTEAEHWRSISRGLLHRMDRA